MNAIKTIEKTIDDTPYKLSIFNDEYAEDPRTWDNLGTMVLFHRRYDLPNEKGWTHEQAQEFCDSEEAKNYIILPIWGYDHSGLAIKAGERTYPFNDRWDSGQLGIIFAPKVHGQSDDDIIEALKSEAEVYSQYLNGEVYYFTLEKGELFKNADGTKSKILYDHEDSCGGFYDFETMASYLPEAFKEDLK